jgi:meromycolic acid enoyl-[acyl-carrier-protein] reductase
MGILDGKKILITGVLTDDSLAFGVAELALNEGADVILTGVGRGMSLTQRVARKLPSTVEVIEWDVTNPEHGTAVREHVQATWGRLDGALHAIGFAPAACLGNGVLGSATWEEVATAVHVSAYSLQTMADALLPLFRNAGGGSLVGLDFDATVAWPAYDWMGIAKAALESLNRYLARDLGVHKVRCNLVAAGPMRTLAAKSIPGFARFEERWQELAPLGWDVRDPTSVSRSCVAMLSDWFPMTTGEIIHVDGGYHAIGA